VGMRHGGRVCGSSFRMHRTAIPMVQSYNREPPLDLPRVLSVTRSATTGRLPLTLAGASTVPVPHCTTPYAQLGTR